MKFTVYEIMLVAYKISRKNRNGCDTQLLGGVTVEDVWNNSFKKVEKTPLSSAANDAIQSISLLRFFGLPWPGANVVTDCAKAGVKSTVTKDLIDRAFTCLCNMKDYNYYAAAIEAAEG